MSWDRIFDSANSDNEFADEQYLGSQGLSYLTSADQHVDGTPLVPSRALKVLWLTQQSARIPRTVGNLARLLVDHLDTDVLKLERDLATTLDALEERNYVRLEPATNQWRFLTQDQVTFQLQDVGVEVIHEEPGKIADGPRDTCALLGAYHSYTRNGDFPKVEMHNPLQAHGEILKTLTDDDMHNVTAYLVTLK